MDLDHSTAGQKTGTTSGHGISRNDKWPGDCNEKSRLPGTGFLHYQGDIRPGCPGSENNLFGILFGILVFVIERWLFTLVSTIQIKDFFLQSLRGRWIG